LRRHLYQFVLVDPLQRLLQRHLAGRAEDDVLVAAGSADVGELPPPGHVDVQIVRVGVLAADHPFVHGDAGTIEERAALLDVEERSEERRVGKGWRYRGWTEVWE